MILFNSVPLQRLCGAEMLLLGAAAEESFSAFPHIAASSLPASCLFLSLLFHEPLGMQAMLTHQEVHVHVRLDNCKASHLHMSARDLVAQL